MNPHIFQLDQRMSFANNEQASIAVFIAVLHAKYNLIKFRLYNIIDHRKLYTVSWGPIFVGWDSPLYTF